MTSDTKEIPGPFDAFDTAKPNEPIFTLQGGDILAPPLVESWADGARRLAADESNERARRHLLLKATSADEVAWKMRDYQRGQLEAATVADTASAEEAEEILDSYDKQRNASNRLNMFGCEILEHIEALRNNDRISAHWLIAMRDLANQTMRIADNIKIKRASPETS